MIVRGGWGTIIYLRGGYAQCWVFPTKISSHLMVETSQGNPKNTKYVYVDSVVKGTFFRKQ